jgi:hypothetical protein
MGCGHKYVAKEIRMIILFSIHFLKKIKEKNVKCKNNQNNSSVTSCDGAKERQRHD